MSCLFWPNRSSSSSFSSISSHTLAGTDTGTVTVIVPVATCSSCMFMFVRTFVMCAFAFAFAFPFATQLVLVNAQCNTIDQNGNPGGTPSPQALVMWVSSGTYDGNLGGRTGANALCTDMHPSKVASQALLSYSDQNAIDAIPAGVDIVNTKGQCIAANREDLFKGLRLAAWLYDETTAAAASNINVFTATTSDGYKAGLGFNFPAEDYADPDPFPDKYCEDFTSTTASTASSLGKLEAGDDNNGKWVQFDIQSGAEQCGIKNHIYCITSAPAPTQSTTTENTVAQDPQFVGLQGQRFQVHGIPEEYFNLVSHPFFQLNSHFTYLATGTCNYNDTACWSHPGTYVDELGLMLPGYEIGIFAGEHQHGLTVTVNGRAITPIVPTTTTTTGSYPFHARFPLRIDNDTIDSMSHHTHWLEPQTTTITTTTATSTTTTTSSSDTNDARHSSSWLLSCHVSVSLLSPVHVVIDTPVATLDIYNADHFFNFALEFRAPRLLLAGAALDRVGVPTRGHGHAHTATAAAGSHASKSAAASISPATSPHPSFPMHGLVGQTWKNVKYPHGRLYAGEVDDYMLSDRRLFSTNFVYNEYQY